MDSVEKHGSQTIQAYATTAVGSLLTMSCMNLLPEGFIQYGVVCSSIVTPFLSLFIVRLYLGVSEPSGLTLYKTRLTKDMKAQRKSLRDTSLSKKARGELQLKYDMTAIKLSTANQDYTSGAVVVSEPEGLV